MNVRTMRSILWLATATCVVGGTLAVCLAALLPLEQPAQRDDLPINHAASATEPAGAVPLAAFAAVWDRDLRPPLYDAPEAPAPLTAEPALAGAVMPTVHLAGTVVESGHSLALVRSDAGRTEFKSVGDEIAGMKVVEVRDDSIVVKWNGSNIRIPIEQSSGPAVPAGHTGPPSGEDRQ